MWKLPATTGGQQVWLDTDYSNDRITWDKSVTISNLLLTSGQGGVKNNGNCYTGQQTINSGITVTSSNGVGFSGQNGSLSIFFDDANSRLVQSGGGNVWESFNFTTASTTPVDGFDVTGGTVEIGSSGNYTNITQVGITILSNATVYLDGVSVLQLTNGTGYVNVNGLGGMLFLDGTVKGSFMFIRGDNPSNLSRGGEEVQINNNGEVYFDSVFGGGSILYVPVWNNGGLFRLYGGATTPDEQGGKLYVEGITADTQGMSVLMTGGRIVLFGGVTLYTGSGYMQEDGSTLATVDSLTETLNTEGKTAQIGSGSFIQPNADGRTYGTLTLVGNVNMNGTYKASCDSNSNKATIIAVTGTFTWGSNSAITMAIFGTGDITGKQWLLGTATAGVIGSPASVPNGWQYIGGDTGFSLYYNG